MGKSRPIPTNPIERKAYEWLRNQGCKQILYQKRKTPDFITDKGNFEVKRLYGNAIIFGEKQIETVKKTNAKILVFSEHGEEPVAIIPPERIFEGNIVNGIMIRTNAPKKEKPNIILEGVPLSINETLVLRLYHYAEKKVGKTDKDTLRQLLEIIIDTYLSKEGF